MEGAAASVTEPMDPVASAAMRRARLALKLAWIGAVLGSGSALAEVCADEYASCREDCSVEHGTTTAARVKLGRCMERCDERASACRQGGARRSSLRERTAEDEARTSSRPAGRTVRDEEGEGAVRPRGGGSAADEAFEAPAPARRTSGLTIDERGADPEPARPIRGRGKPPPSEEDLAPEQPARATRAAADPDQAGNGPDATTTPARATRPADPDEARDRHSSTAAGAAREEGGAGARASEGDREAPRHADRQPPRPVEEPDASRTERASVEEEASSPAAPPSPARRSRLSRGREAPAPAQAAAPPKSSGVSRSAADAAFDGEEDAPAAPQGTTRGHAPPVAGGAAALDVTPTAATEPPTAPTAERTADEEGRPAAEQPRPVEIRKSYSTLPEREALPPSPGDDRQKKEGYQPKKDISEWDPDE